jgi:hypothetical protein
LTKAEANLSSHRSYSAAADGSETLRQINAKIDGIATKIDKNHEELHKKIDNNHKDTNKKIGKLSRQLGYAVESSMR